MTGREFDRFFIAIFRPDLLALVDSLPPYPPSPDTVGPGRVKPKPKPKAPGRSRAPIRKVDPTRYHFLTLHGRAFIGTRREFARIAPDVNPGSLCDLVRGKIGYAKGWRCLGPVADAEKEEATC